MRRPNNPEIIAGRVNTDGSVAAGDNFFVQKQGTGVYGIIVPGSKRVISATATMAVAASAFVSCTDFTGNRFNVRVFVWNTAATAGDSAFNFNAVVES